MKSLTSKMPLAVVAVIAAVAMVAPAPAVQAIGEGQVEGGNIYRIKNVTRNVDFADPAVGDKCETFQYKLRIHNPGPGVLGNVTVKATLPSEPATQHVSTATVTSTNAQPATTSDTATLNLVTAQKIAYQSGTTELLDTNNAKLRDLPDGITSGVGVNIGDVRVSLNEIRYVQFQVKSDCPQPPVTPPAYSCDAFNIVANADRTVRINVFNTTATNGATFKNADVNWGDGSAVLTDTSLVGKTHQYPKDKDGTYTLVATARFTVNGQDVTASGPGCTTSVTFKGDKPPVVTPPNTPPATPAAAAAAPSSLVAVGAEGIFGIFAAVTLAGAAAYRFVIGRRLGNQ